jgi:hypothetical protein
MAIFAQPPNMYNQPGMASRYGNMGRAERECRGEVYP